MYLCNSDTDFISLLINRLMHPHPLLNLVHQLESVVLLLGDNIKVFLVDRLALPSSVTPLDPSVLPVQVRRLTGHVHLAVFHREERAVLTESHIQSWMEPGVPLRSQYRASRHCVSILHSPAAMFRPRLPVDVFCTSSGLFARVSNKVWKDSRLLIWN